MKIKELKEKYGPIAIMICLKDRPSELCLLLQSLRTQTYNSFNIYIVDDFSGTLLTQYHFLNCLFNLLQLENHNIMIKRHPFNFGVSKSRQSVVDYVMEEGQGEKLFCRIDDDVLVQPDYLQKLVETIDAGYDLASGITTPALMHPTVRETRFLGDVVNEVKLNDNGEFVENSDDCGILYDEEKIIPCHHFRSCALYKREIHEAGVNYKSNLSKYGFREEQILSWKIILAGFTMAVNTGAVNFHMLTPSGGERVNNANDLTKLNEEVLHDYTRKMYKKHGDFIKRYNEKLNIKPKSYKSKTNLIL